MYQFSGLVVLFRLIVLATTTNESMHSVKLFPFYRLALTHVLLLSFFISIAFSYWATEMNCYSHIFGRDQEVTISFAKDNSLKVLWSVYIIVSLLKKQMRGRKFDIYTFIHRNRPLQPHPFTWKDMSVLWIFLVEIWT